MHIYVIVKIVKEDNGREKTIVSKWPVAVYTNPDDARIKCKEANNRNTIKNINYEVEPYIVNDDKWLLWTGNK